MATRRRKPPKQDAIEHAVKALDKTAELEVQYINSFKGRGVFAKTPFRKGDFVVEYRGELINSKESQRRRRTYHNKCAVFMFDFYWQEKTWCVDAAREDGSLGRLVNDDHKHPNCKMKRVITEGKPHLCLFALKDINEGEEITYDYGGTDWPWRKQEDKQSDATESFETDIFRTTEQTPQRSSSFKTQEDKQSDATESFETDIFRTTEQTPQRSSSFKTQEDKQSDATESFETDIFRTTEQTPQRSSSFKTQEDKQSDATESFETDIFRTTEQTPQRSSSFKTQCPHDPEPLPSINKVGMNPSLVDYTDSDESQSPSTNHDQFNSSCQTWCPTSEFEISLTHQDGDYIPRLRRTKSIQMNRKVEFASDELFDPTSGSSGEEYIPHSSEDSSEGTDTSEVIQPVNQKESMLRFPILGKYADIGELNDVSSKQILNRGRSPSRRGGNSGMRRKRQCSSSSRRASYPTTHASSGHSTKRSGEGDPESVLQKTTPDLEKDLPDSASSLHTEDVADGSLSISAVCKKENGSRMYNKKQYCLYCREGFVKMARHLERAHKDKPEVAQALSFPKGSKERRMHMEYLRNRGNFAHNVDVLNAGVGNLVPRKQPRKDCQAQNFLHCIHCHGFFTKKVLWRHMMTCKFKPSVPQKNLAKTRGQALCAFAVPPPPGVKVEFWKLLNNMVQDEVYSVLKSDVCIMEYGEHLYNRLGYDVGKHEYIRQKLRELGRLLICSRKTTSLKTIKDHVKPANFMQVVESVKHLAGYDSKNPCIQVPKSSSQNWTQLDKDFNAS
uniref:SET domain-containing protein n=1 Tax=Cyprinus carpio carpio TaxID=630221 RepID=A0A9J8D6C4_CYPCA